MIKISKIVLILLTIMNVCALVSANNMQDMVNQYRGMGENTSANYPRELEMLLPQGFNQTAKFFVYTETAKMFLILGMSGKKPTTAYKNPYDVNEYTVHLLAYNPVSNAHMKAQMPVILEYSIKGYKKGNEENSGNYKYEKVVSLKVNQFDVFIQKKIWAERRNRSEKIPAQSYYFVNAIMLKNNMLFNIEIKASPSIEEANSIINDITKKINNTNFAKYIN
jgi:hypothetical protein